VIVLAFWLKLARTVTDASSKWNVSKLGNALAYCLQKAELFISAQDMNEEKELQVSSSLLTLVVSTIVVRQDVAQHNDFSQVYAPMLFRTRILT
jgi:hypothetical protein